MASSITLAGESLKAQKQGAHEVLEIRNFVLALVPGLDPNSPIDRSAGLPPAEQIVGTWPYTQKGFVDPNRVVYSLMLGSDVGDFDWNWIGLTTAEGVLFAVSTVPVQQKRRNIPPLQTGNNVTRNFMLAFDGAQALTAITVEAGTWQHDFTTALAGKLDKTGGTLSGRLVAEKDDQTGYASAAIESKANSGDVLISLHASGVSAVAIRHRRGGPGIEVEDVNGSPAPVKASYFDGPARQSEWATEAGYSASAGHAQTADEAFYAARLRNASGTPMTFDWSGQEGQPTWLWGSLSADDPAHMCVYNPANFHVSSANRAGVLNWTAPGAGHYVFDASSGVSPGGTAVGNVDPSVPWGISYPTLMGWDGARTYGVRVDRARVAETAQVADALAHNVFPSTGNTYATAALELRGDSADGIHPSLCFHSPNVFAGVLRMVTGTLYQFLDIDNELADLAVRHLYGNAQTASALAQDIVINGTPVNAGSQVTIRAVPVETRYWQDVTTSRHSGVNYINTDSVSRHVAITIDDSGETIGPVFYSGGKAFPISDLDGGPVFISLPIRPGDEYSLNAIGSHILSWLEFSEQ